MKSKKTILITGVAGFIGFHTAKKLLEKGNNVVGIDNLNDYYDVKLKKKRLLQLSNKNFRFIKCDFSDWKSLNKRLSTVSRKKFDAIIHLGAQAGVRYSIENPFAYAEANYIGTLNIFEYAKQNKIPHVIYASTSSVYGKNEKQPFEETDSTDSAISTYAATKKGTEVLAHAYSHLFKIKMTGLRFFTVYGPWGRPDMALFKFAKNILLGKTIQVYNNGEMSRSFTYIDDIVSGVVGALDAKKQYAIYNLGGADVVGLMDFVRLIEKNINKSAKIKFLPMQAGDVKETVASTKLAEREIGYSAKTGIEDGIEKFTKWFLENQNLLLKLKDGKQ
jgi:UDP-glucuronate 4-epimerase